MAATEVLALPRRSSWRSRALWAGHRSESLWRKVFKDWLRQPICPDMSAQPGRKTPSTEPVAGCDDAFLTTEELSVLLKVPENTLKAWRNKRKGPLFHRHGVHVRYPKSLVNQWLAECTAEAERWMVS